MRRPPSLRVSENTWRSLSIHQKSSRESEASLPREGIMNKVYIANDPMEAHLVRSLLEREGIEAEVQGESLFGLRPRIGLDSDSLPSVWITNEAQLKQAINVLAD